VIKSYAEVLTKTFDKASDLECSLSPNKLDIIVSFKKSGLPLATFYCVHTRDTDDKKCTNLYHMIIKTNDESVTINLSSDVLIENFQW
jgi:hypothetical protein